MTDTEKEHIASFLEHGQIRKLASEWGRSRSVVNQRIVRLLPEIIKEFKDKI
tara:strand:+ start:171 stop:326 length:156 start_codon:yes stop_codon:yes gene_type:complete